MVLMHVFPPHSALTWLAQKQGIIVTNDVSYAPDLATPFMSMRPPRLARPLRWLCSSGLAGPYDFLPLHRELQGVFGPEVNWPKSQPVNYVSADALPMLLMTGMSDGKVNYDNTLHLAERLCEKGVKVEVKLYPGLSHYGVIAALSDALTFMAPVRDTTLRFIKERGTCGD